MTIFSIKLAGFAALALLCAGCAPEKPSETRPGARAAAQTAAGGELEQEAVLVVDEEAITLAEFNRRIEALPEFAKVRYSSLEKRQQYLNDVAQFEVMVDRAEELGYGARPEVRSALEAAIAQRLVDEVLRERIAEEDEVDRAAIRAHYEEHRDEFETPGARRVALIEVGSREEAERLRARVIEEQADADDPVIAFRRAAARFSRDRISSKKGGDIGFVLQPGSDEIDPQEADISEAVFELTAPGTITEPVAVDDGFVLATFFETREAQTSSLEGATAQIREALLDDSRREIRRDLLEELRAEIDVSIDRKVAEGATSAHTPDDEARTVDRLEDVSLSNIPAFGEEDADAPN